MDALVLIVAFLSLAMAIVLSVVVVRLLRAEGERSRARVALLREMAAEAGTPEPENDASEHPAFGAPKRDDASSDRLRYRDDVIATSSDARLDRCDTGTDDRLAGIGPLFVEPETASPWTRRLGIAGACAAAMVVLLFASTWISRSSVPSGHEQQQAQVAVPLELVALEHSQQADSLTISGLVQNPRNGEPLSKVVATAFLFDRDGAFLASGHAALDFTILAPGEESPFVVMIPTTRAVARYRVGFRTEDGRVIGHVDKRPAGSMALRAWAPTVLVKALAARAQRTSASPDRSVGGA